MMLQGYCCCKKNKIQRRQDQSDGTKPQRTFCVRCICSQVQQTSYEKFRKYQESISHQDYNIFRVNMGRFDRYDVLLTSMAAVCLIIIVCCMTYCY